MLHSIPLIEESLGRLRKSEAKVASYIPGNAEKIIHFSLHEMAETTGVSEPTVIRFCRQLGFSGWQEFKIYLAQAIIPKVQHIHESVAEGDNSSVFAQKILQANITSIQETLRLLDNNAVERAIDMLSGAGKILFHGMGGSACVAMDAYHKFFRTGLICEWTNDPHMAAITAAMMTPRDVFVAISHSGATRDIITSLDFVRQSGAGSIALVSHQKTPIAKKVDVCISVVATDVNYRFEPMSSRIAQLCVIDVLSVGVGLRRTDELYENLAKSRKAISSKRL